MDSQHPKIRWSVNLEAFDRSEFTLFPTRNLRSRASQLENPLHPGKGLFILTEDTTHQFRITRFKESL